jgi:hypothetical protein
MGSTVCSYGEPHVSESKEFTVNGVRLWGKRCADMGECREHVIKRLVF